MTRDEYLALLRRALSSEHGVALEIGFYAAERPNGRHMVIMADEGPRVHLWYRRQ